MRAIGQLSLLAAFVAAGYGSFAALAGWLGNHRRLRQSGVAAAISSAVGLSAAVLVLAWALVTKDFSFRYVADYSSWLLAWYYSLAALWVGQAGSLLLWAWLLSVLSLTYRFWPGTSLRDFRDATLGILMGCVFFLLTIMLFGADPMERSVIVPKEGIGLGPLLHHPAMLVHPPIVFIGYAAWTIPFALTITGLIAGKLDSDWVRETRPWSVFAWAVLGAGILLGASWAYEELGWGGYWGWDPVENGSLIPWLTGSALVHSLMAWHYRGVLKKAAVSLSIITFGMCNFATFLTRSGVFSSIHAFSQSPIGWMFLLLMVALVIGGVSLVRVRHRELAADSPIATVWSREAFILFSAVLLLLFSAVTTAGTVMVPVSKLLLGRQITVGPAFYNNVLIPIGLLLLGTIVWAPLLQWGKPPGRWQTVGIFSSLGFGSVAAVLGLWCGLRSPIAIAVTSMAAAAVAALAACIWIDIQKRVAADRRGSWWRTFVDNRRQYAGFFIHVGFVALAIGITGSSLGTVRQEVYLDEGESFEWNGRLIRYEKLVQSELPDKLIAEAVLNVSSAAGPGFILRPARHLHLLQNEWTTEVAIHSDWTGDFYTILNNGEGEGRVGLTFVLNPLMRFVWLGGTVMVVGALVSIWPARRKPAWRTPQPHFAESSLRSRESLNMCNWRTGGVSHLVL